MRHYAPLCTIMQGLAKLSHHVLILIYFISKAVDGGTCLACLVSEAQDDSRRASGHPDLFESILVRVIMPRVFTISAVLQDSGVTI